MQESKFIGFDLRTYFYSLVTQIPKGMVSTYGELALSLGDIKAAKACGYMLSIDHDRSIVPGHRVVRSTGEIGKYSHSYDISDKVNKLEAEGTYVKEGHVENFQEKLFNEFRSDMPLREIAAEQDSMARSVSTEDHYELDRIAAVDVSYDEKHAYAALVVEDGGTQTVTTRVTETKFPYIPGYLSYHEYPAIESLLRSYRGLLLVDGNGILHPRGIGLASFIGVMMDIPTIGVAKSLLMGQVDQSRVSIGERYIGYMLNQHMIVSPGNRVSMETSVELVNSLNSGKYPAILKAAHDNTVKLRKDHTPH